MALTTGGHVGPYEILGALGAGGMGEVLSTGAGTSADRFLSMVYSQLKGGK